MSWNHSKKHLVIKCPECKSPRVSVSDSNYEWRCLACETVGPELDLSW